MKDQRENRQNSLRNTSSRGQATPAGTRSFRLYSRMTLRYFHGTAASNLESILKIGFRPTAALGSSSFARNSGLALGYACSKRSETPQMASSSWSGSRMKMLQGSEAKPSGCTWMIIASNR
jgi:hypothetical protein